jgi:hypothetical protein
MQFRTPQFIDIEDKIFGPFTFLQFVYLAGGAGLAFVAYKMLPTIIALFIVPLIAGTALMLTFYRINNKPFIEILESGIKFAFQKKLYVWKRGKLDIKEKIVVPEEIAKIPKKNLSESKLQDISWSLDVLDIKDREKSQ